LDTSVVARVPSIFRRSKRKDKKKRIDHRGTEVQRLEEEEEERKKKHLRGITRIRGLHGLRN
jgi:hypothetical protein